MPPDEIAAPAAARPNPRERIIAAAVKLVSDGGMEAATTRAIAEEALVQPPTIFRNFGDKDGLLDVIAERLTEAFFAKKMLRYGNDPIENLRTGMRMFMEFGVGHPDVYLHMYGRPSRSTAAASKAVVTLRQRVREAAMTGRLAVSESQAFNVLNSLSRGTVMLMLERAEGERAGMIEEALDSAMAVIAAKSAPDRDFGPRGAAAMLGAHLDEAAALTKGERMLMAELLKRIAEDRTPADEVGTAFPQDG